MLRFLSIFCIFALSSFSYAEDVPITIFPLTNYSQDINKWLNPYAANYDQPLVSVSYQKNRKRDFLDHWLSPWNASYVKKTISQTDPDIVTIEQYFLTKFDNNGKAADALNYRENFRLASADWINKIRQNLPLESLSNIKFDPAHYAVVTSNTSARLLPSQDPSFYHFTLAGQGYPFDNLQVSAVWAGTPVYVIATTRDQSWDLVLTPAFLDWIPAHDVAYVSTSQRKQYMAAARKHFGVIIKTQSPIKTRQGNVDFVAYVGSAYPILGQHQGQTQILAFNRNHLGNAVTSTDNVADSNMVEMPYLATPHHFAMLYKTLLNRPYGWGGMYFYNDCSQELRSLYAPFGIWLGRNSASQSDAGVTVDESAQTMSKRLSYLVRNGHPLMTIIYIGGHVMQYVNHFPGLGGASDQVAMTYQNVWGMHPPKTVQPNRRDVIGESVFFPLLTQYPEVPDDVSEADSHYFKVTYLDQMPTTLALTKVPTLIGLMQP